MSDAITEIIERLSAIISGLGFLLPFAIVLILRLFSGKSKSPEQQQQPQPQQRQAQPQPRPSPTTEQVPGAQGEAVPIPGFPFAPPAWMEMMQPQAEQRAEEPQPSQWRDPVQPASQWGHTFDRQDDAEDEALKWGSAFDYEDGEPARWGSAYRDDYGKTKYGFEKAQWGKTFPERDSEPVVNFG